MKEHFVEVERGDSAGSGHRWGEKPDRARRPLRLRVIEDGQGIPVVVLHGFTGDAESMECVSQGLADRYRVLRLELVGHGKSDAPAELEAYSMSACAAQVGSVVKSLGLERPHLIGYSMGGRAALASVVAHPELFASLVLVGATAGIADPDSRDERIRSDRALADRIESSGVESFVDHWMSLPIFASQGRLGASALRRARAQRLRNSATGLAQSLRGMGAGAQSPLFADLPSIARPVLLVVGEEDAKFSAIAADLAAALPDARIASLPGAGHAAHLEAPKAFAAVVSGFLGGGSPRE